MSDSPQDAKGIFLAALDIQDPAERAALVERSCGGDAALRQRVEDLLRAYGQPDGPLEKLAAALAPTDLTEPIGEQVGAIIAGRYKLLESLGQGGMGAVFMAQQTQPVKRVVALKLIKLGMDSKQVLARFEAERQALALMDHPNIAKVLDAGATDSGRPFFVMELVKGVPITRFCDERQLSPRQRLELFIPVCQAIQHAHQKGIIHRDIKPTNVLVALYDDRPVPKVIDFGVAKAAGLQLTDASLVTGFGAIVGTPEYMSPEQAQLNQLDIDTRSDVYALGVLLYELLTGTTPIDRNRLGQGALFEVLRIIREEEPLRPSTRLSTSDALASIAATRRTEPARLAKLMRGELDWIVMKCLEKDRSRRYETANGLAHDIERYLQDELVEAQPPTAGYRLRKFARKHRKPVIALASIAAVLVLGIVGTTWGLFRARQAEQEADTSKKEAIDALGQARKDRDAKEAARIAEARERDRAERQLANGLLRPIGFSKNSPAESRSFVDWSAIKESPLKLRVLEIALEDPETALRIARRADRAIQSCVGLSPTRRAQAISLVSAKQRDLAADPRIRVAACRLAMELGSADLPAWAESCQWLSDPKHKSIDRFGEFVAFAASRSDPQQVAELTVGPLLPILETSTNDEVLRNLSKVLPRFAPRLDQSQTKRAWDALLAILEKSNDDNVRFAASDVLVALAPRLEPAQVTRAADALLAILQKSKDDKVRVWAVQVLVAQAPRLEPAQAKRAWDALLAIPEKWSDFNDGAGVNWASKVLVALAPRLGPAQSKPAWDALLAILEKSNDDNVRFAASDVLVALAPRLEPAQVTRAADALLAILQKSKDDKVRVWAVQVLVALAPRLEPAQSKPAWDALLAILQKSKGDQTSAAASNVLAALAPRLEPAQVMRAADALLAILEKSNDDKVRSAASDVLVALAPRLEPAQVTRIADALIAILEKSKDFQAHNHASEALVALAPRLEPAQVTRAGDALLAILQKSKDDTVRRAASQDLTALAPRLEPAQAKRAWDALLAILQKSEEVPPDWASQGLVALAPRLEAAQAKRAWDALLAILEESVGTPYWASQGLVALASRLEPAQVTRAGDALLAILEKPKDDHALSAASQGLVALASRLEPAQVTRAGDAQLAILEKSEGLPYLALKVEVLVALASLLEPAQAKRAWDTLLATLEKSKDDIVRDAASAGLVALAPRLEPASRDRLATKATTSLLDYCALFGHTYDYDIRGMMLRKSATRLPPELDPLNPNLRPIRIARSITSLRSLAKLLSHPACVGEQRESLLQRFEELVFYDGKPMFLKAENADGKQPAHEQAPPRRFHNLDDAAAWIQQNWPDFDLETSYPVTWPTEIHQTRSTISP